MRIKAVSMLLLLLGGLILAQAVQQANQYWTTQPVVKQSLKLIGTVAEVALLAFHQGIGKLFDVAAGHPDAGVHEDGGIQANDVVALLDHGLPPGALDVIL